MFNKFTLMSLLVFSVIFVIYPTKKENIILFDYCYALEKIISKNSIQNRINLSGRVKSISKDIAKFGYDNTRGNFIYNIVDQYKNSKNSFIVNLIPNKIYCFAGYWIESLKPGTFESIFYKEGKKNIDEFKDLKKEVDLFLNDINSEYKNIKENLNNFF